MWSRKSPVFEGTNAGRKRFFYRREALAAELRCRAPARVKKQRTWPTAAPIVLAREPKTGASAARHSPNGSSKACPVHPRRGYRRRRGTTPAPPLAALAVPPLWCADQTMVHSPSISYSTKPAHNAGHGRKIFPSTPSRRVAPYFAVTAVVCSESAFRYEKEF